MTFVKYATVCDYADCNARSVEYTRFAECRECQRYFCLLHSAKSTFDMETGTVVCLFCQHDLIRSITHGISST